MCYKIGYDRRACGQVHIRKSINFSGGVEALPYERWFKLSDIKKDKIIQASMHEFATKTFEEVSINQIIKKADISRGSFYTYFEDKEDLYRYITSDLVDTVIQALYSILNDQGKDVFDTLKLLHMIAEEKHCVAMDAADVLHMVSHKSMTKGAKFIYQSEDRLSKIFYECIQREYDIPPDLWNAIYHILYALMYQDVRERASEEEVKKLYRERLFASLDYIKSSLIPYKK